MDTSAAGAGCEAETDSKGGDISRMVVRGAQRDAVAAEGSRRAVKKGRLARVLP